LRVLDPPNLGSEGRRSSARDAARFGGSQRLCGRKQAPPAPDSRSSDPLGHSELRVSELIATKIASRLVLEGTGYGRYDSGDSLPESPVIHTTVRLVASGRSFGTLLCSQEPWSRSPPGCSHPADASGREVRPGTPRVRPSVTVAFAAPHRQGTRFVRESRDSILPGPGRQTRLLGRRAERDGVERRTFSSGRKTGIRSKAECRARSTWLMPPPVVSPVNPEIHPSAEPSWFEGRRFRRHQNAKLLREVGHRRPVSLLGTVAANRSRSEVDGRSHLAPVPRVRPRLPSGNTR
jgi:hypothetical protein